MLSDINWEKGPFINVCSFMNRDVSWHMQRLPARWAGGGGEQGKGQTSKEGMRFFPAATHTHTRAQIPGDASSPGNSTFQFSFLLLYLDDGLRPQVTTTHTEDPSGRGAPGPCPLSRPTPAILGIWEVNQWKGELSLKHPLSHCLPPCPIFINLKCRATDRGTALPSPQQPGLGQY